MAATLATHPTYRALLRAQAQERRELDRLQRTERLAARAMIRASWREKTEVKR